MEPLPKFALQPVIAFSYEWLSVKIVCIRRVVFFAESLML